MIVLFFSYQLHSHNRYILSNNEKERLNFNNYNNTAIDDETSISDEILNTNSIYFGLSYGNKKFLTDANVTIYKQLDYNNTSHEYDLLFFDIPGNPLNRTNGVSYGKPIYRFDNLPNGDYTIIAEKNGKRWILGKTVNFDREDCITFITVDDPNIYVPSDINIDKFTLFGFVRDKDGEYIPGAYVTLLRMESKSGAAYLASDIQHNPMMSYSGQYTGFYYFKDLVPGWYTLKCEKNGYVGTPMVIYFSGFEEGGRSLELRMI